ncbi:MAG TPA: ShlB/FhaC/HecB family hemolysin secretion/activation protein, partial [Sinorhizobium sp.]|nr:ShlB/FhaC/HecB family hemolysin secretion/activation protein [Sinorhizobium sp.]
MVKTGGSRRRRRPAATLAIITLSTSLLSAALTTSALAQQLPGPAEPGVPPVAPPEIPTPAVPPSVLPEVEPLAPPPGAEQVRFVLSALTIDGVTVYAPESLEPLYAGLLGREVALTEIFAVAEAITAKYRSDGYIISRAVVPAQRIENGAVRIEVLEGFVDKVTVQGRAPAVLTDYVEQIRAVRPLTADALERYLLLANDLAGVTARAVLSASPAVPQAADLVVVVDDKPFDGFATLDNRGSRFVGPVQFQVGGRLNSPLGFGEQIEARAITTSTTDELRFLELGVSAPIGPEGTMVALTGSTSRSEPGFTLEPLEIENKTDTVALAVTHPLLRTRASTLRVQGRFDYGNFDSDILGTRLSEDRLRVLRANGSYDLVDPFAGVNLVSVELSQGLDILGARETGSPDLSRANGHSDFTKVTFAASRLQRVTENINALAAAAGQYAFDPLLSSEEFGLGGPEFLRAFDPSEQVGDHGLAGRLELQFLVDVGEP